jgi:hypothetical protein
LGSFLHQRRERKKRDEHRWKVWKFQDMQRSAGSLQPPPSSNRGRGGRAFQSTSEITLVPSREVGPTGTPDQRTASSSEARAPVANRPRYPGETRVQGTSNNNGLLLLAAAAM